MSKTKVLFGLTGSIACYKACSVISALIKDGFEVQVVASASALKFVGEATLEGLTSKPVISQSFSTGHMMDHIRLAREADIFIIAPLTAHHIGLFAHGLADDFISTLVLAYEPHKPLLVAPAMNTIMWQASIVQENLQALENRNFKILRPNAGVLACGEDGVGKMQEPEQILSAIKSALAILKETKKVLVTFGGTREAIDGVRSITNTSTGRTGAEICDALVRDGVRVVALHAKGSVLPTTNPSLHLELKSFTTSRDLDNQMRELLAKNKFDGVIHLAAISDFSVDHVEVEGRELATNEDLKLSSNQEVKVVLKPAKKIVNHIKEYAKDLSLPVVAFKLTKTNDQKAIDASVQKLFDSGSAVDFVVHNDENKIDRSRNEHSYQLYRRNGKSEAIGSTRDLAQKMTELVYSLTNNMTGDLGESL